MKQNTLTENINKQLYYRICFTILQHNYPLCSVYCWKCC